FEATPRVVAGSIRTATSGPRRGPRRADRRPNRGCKISDRVAYLAQVDPPRRRIPVAALGPNPPRRRADGCPSDRKTSTLRRLFPRHAFVSLDLPTEAEQAEKEPATFLSRHPAPAIVDEVQYAPALFRHLKVVVDARRKRAGQYLLTGSQKFTLMKGVSESLAGRADIVELETLSLAETQNAMRSTRLEAAMVRGGFPEL